MITQDQVIQAFTYKDGELFHATNKKNQTRKGDFAGCVNSTGYMLARLAGKKYLVHRLVFLMFNGYLPEYVDHIDGNCLNNKTENLREATFSQNKQNTLKYKNNTSGVKGVNWCKEHKKWNARVQTDNKRKFLGRFDTIEEAKSEVFKYRKANHGEFANNG